MEVPARRANQGIQAVVMLPVFTRTRGGWICTAATVPRRMRFSIRRASSAIWFMPLMLRLARTGRTQCGL
ncbi:hypothetical protein D3C80_1961270 [compost metagenome]